MIACGSRILLCTSQVVYSLLVKSGVLLVSSTWICLSDFGVYNKTLVSKLLGLLVKHGFAQSQNACLG